ATDLDVAPRARLPGASGFGVPAELLKRCVSRSEKPYVEMIGLAGSEARPFAVNVEGATLAGLRSPGFPQSLRPLSGPRDPSSGVVPDARACPCSRRSRGEP